MTDSQQKPFFHLVLGGDATKPEGSGTKLISHVCNDVGAWGAGFVVALSKKWKEPEAAYRDWYRDRAYTTAAEKDTPFELGRIQLVPVAPEIIVVNMLAQTGIQSRQVDIARPPLRYGALVKCMVRTAKQAEYLKASIHCPKFGSGLAGGKWEIIEELIKEIWLDQGISVTVYDFQAK
jgi:hypothetical protein